MSSCHSISIASLCESGIADPSYSEYWESVYVESLKLTRAEYTLAVEGFTDTSIPMGGDVSVLARKTCFCTVAPRASFHSRSVTDDRVRSRSETFWNSI